MIKFRAWDNRYKEYIKNVMVDGRGKVYFDDDVATQDDLDIHIEQFTGLTDVNGKDIYKGDIVRMQHPGFHEYACYEVKYFIQDVCIFQIVKVTDGSTLFESPSNGHDVEVIGNVHASQELLGE